MSKTLITVDNLQDFIHDNRLNMDADKILTAGARDELTRRGVDVVYDAAPAGACAAHAATTPADTDLLVGVAAIIKQHYGITDPEDLKKVTLETVATIGKGLH